MVAVIHLAIFICFPVNTGSSTAPIKNKKCPLSNDREHFIYRQLSIKVCLSI